MPGDPKGEQLAQRQRELINKLEDTQALTVTDVAEALDIIQECLGLATSQNEIGVLLAYLIILGGEVVPKQMVKGDPENGTIEEWLSVYEKIERTLIVYSQVFDTLN